MTTKKRKSLLKSTAFRIIYPLSEKYLSKERTYRYKDITIKVFPGVFHPGFFYSTKILLNFLEGIELNKKNVLELGAGTGLVSIYASDKGGFVTASDINLTSINNIEKNAELNNAKIEVIHSDLFDQIPKRRYDYIIINPPYYKKKPTTQKEFAWFCGDDFQYFRKLFAQLAERMNEITNAIMILSDEADIGSIKNIGTENKLLMEEIYRKKTLGEKHFIFKIKRIESV
jgi:release factor glutamine methyltransferase